jgi:hypothetical protein
MWPRVALTLCCLQALLRSHMPWTAAAAALLALAAWLVAPRWEAVTVLPGLGVQLTTLSRAGWRRTRLLDAQHIRAVLINEARPVCCRTVYLVLHCTVWLLNLL